MRAFAELFAEIDATTSTRSKVSAIRDYLAGAPPADGAWAVFFLAGQRLKRLVPSASLQRWAIELAEVEPRLYRECNGVVGDTAETIALLLESTDITPTATTNTPALSLFDTSDTHD
ncbi:MAG: hypothetical protein AAF747_10570, partial [Planctomycetota bacterium]